MKFCQHCGHTISEKSTNKCLLIIVGIKYLMHYLCALEVKKNAQKEIELLNLNYSWNYKRT